MMPETAPLLVSNAIAAPLAQVVTTAAPGIVPRDNPAGPDDDRPGERIWACTRLWFICRADDCQSFAVTLRDMIGRPP
jgi:hypothetical protein